MTLKTADLLHIENYKLTRNSGYGLIKQYEELILTYMITNGIRDPME